MMAKTDINEHVQYLIAKAVLRAMAETAVAHGYAIAVEPEGQEPEDQDYTTSVDSIHRAVFEEYDAFRFTLWYRKVGEQGTKADGYVIFNADNDPAYNCIIDYSMFLEPLLAVAQAIENSFDPDNEDYTYEVTIKSRIPMK